MPDDATRRCDPAADPVYIHKPSLMGAPWELRLRPEALEWRTARHEGRIPYARVTRVRLSFRPVTMQTRRFLAEVWSAGGPRLSIASTSWRSMAEQAAHDQAYGDFMRELHRRIAAAGAAPAYDRGSPALLYWPGLAVFVGVVAGFAVLIVQALDIGAYGGAAVVGAFFALFAWQGGTYFRRNRPGRYRPDALPADLVPDG
jgi:hypothetical protein